MAEFMEVVRVAFSEALEMVRDGRIVDAKSIDGQPSLFDHPLCRPICRPICAGRAR